MMSCLWGEGKCYDSFADCFDENLVEIVSEEILGKLDSFT